MTYGESLVARLALPGEERSARADVVRATLCEQIGHRLAGAARQLEIEICHDSATVFLTGVVNSFYAKQVLYQLCHRWASDFRVIDTTVVGRFQTR